MSVHAQGLALKADRQMIKNFEETGLYESNIERKKYKNFILILLHIM